MNFAPFMLALGARASVARLIREGGDFDLFDAHYYYPDGAAAALLSRWFKKPFVVTARGSDINLLPNHAIPRRWIRWTEKQAAASIMVSQSLMDRLVALGGNPERMRVMRNGVDLNTFRPEDRQKSRRRLGLRDGSWILSVGNLVETKGHNIAIEALSELPENIHLAIVGDGQERDRLTRLADSLGVSARVNLIGARPQAELKDWYSSADVLVLCSSREGSPNVLLEALACGTPVVATSVGGIPEVIKSSVAGQLIEERTSDALATAIRSVLSSPSNRELIRNYASDFDWHQTTRGQIDIFRAVVRGERIVTASSVGTLG
jgi:glycosyltransferase involved in cell wall biosynthesis